MSNLRLAYQVEFGDHSQSACYDRSTRPREVLQVAREIAALSPTHLIFTDHERHPQDLLQALKDVYGRRAWPQLVFHVFGDFTLQTPQWRRCEKILLGRRSAFVCASPKQRDFIGSLIKQPRKQTALCHFPVREDQFQFNGDQREEGRRRWKIREREFVIVYTGRLSVQKNVLNLIRMATEAGESLGLEFQVLLAGTFDDIGTPFFGLRPAEGTYFAAFKSLMESLSPSVSERVHYLGALGQNDLTLLYNAGDLFASFSAHHDEDYGMSPIEALACGSPAILSDWGGFGAFARRGSCELLPTRLAQGGARVEVERFETLLRSFSNQFSSGSAHWRQERSDYYRSRFGVTAARRHLRALLSHKLNPFAGFTPALHRHAQLLEESTNRGFMFNPHKKIDPDYRTFYQYYAKRTLTHDAKKINARF